MGTPTSIRLWKINTVISDSSPVVSLGKTREMRAGNRHETRNERSEGSARG